MKGILITAIPNRSVLTFTYREHPRTVEPHAMGESTAGNDVLRCFQTEGTTHGGEVPGWLLMLLSEIRNLQVTENVFTIARPGYKRGDSQMRIIYEQI